jgi:hypothetical protein
MLRERRWLEKIGKSMSTADVNPTRLAIGFLTVLDHPQHGLFGGYLVLNAAGRPLEFHCTAPIKPNRAQEILYGPTLAAFLYGEQIGQTLLAQAKTEPALVCTDREPALSVRHHVSLPVALVLPPEVERVDVRPDGPTPVIEGSQRRFRLDGPHLHAPKLIAFQLGRNRLAVAERADDDRRLVAERLGELAASFDLSEPFQRIREAIEEAQQAVR